MPDSLRPVSAEEDERFKYEVIKNLSESVRQIAAGMADIQRTQVGMLERLARLEANKVGEIVAKVEARVEDIDRRTDVLFRDKDRRDGAVGLMVGLRTWGPWVFSLLTVLYLVARQAGIMPSPPTTVTRIETPAGFERRHDIDRQQITHGDKP